MLMVVIVLGISINLIYRRCFINTNIVKIDYGNYNLNVENMF